MKRCAFIIYNERKKCMMAVLVRNKNALASQTQEKVTHHVHKEKSR